MRARARVQVCVCESAPIGFVELQIFKRHISWLIKLAPPSELRALPVKPLAGARTRFEREPRRSGKVAKWPRCAAQIGRAKLKIIGVISFHLARVQTTRAVKILLGALARSIRLGRARRWDSKWCSERRRRWTRRGRSSSFGECASRLSVITSRGAGERRVVRAAVGGQWHSQTGGRSAATGLD